MAAKLRSDMCLLCERLYILCKKKGSLGGGTTTKKDDFQNKAVYISGGRVLIICTQCSV